MIDKYNAFISYRHAKLDSKIAEHVQKSLERFHIPDKIRKSTGKKRIERIFRDKDELPITSDLTETISHALENSDYLIVICSENTKESFWVKREIEYFLRTHSKDQVLTVLAGGEPQDVIPQVLLTRERTFKDENGIEHTVEAPLEPLSCDYRLPIKKADREELPRLASAVIGCSYDELMNRRRAYRIRRAALLAGLLFSLLLAFGIYWLDTSRRIEQSLQEAMRNRSLYLANESIRLSGERDRLTATQLALEAVPETFPDMPLTPQSVRALNEATLAYQSDVGISVEPDWSYYMSGSVRDLCVSPDKEHLAAYDHLGNVRLWDIKTHELIMDVGATDQDIRNISFANDDTLIVVHGASVMAYDVDDAEEAWVVEIGSMPQNGNLHIVDEDTILLVGYDGNLVLVDSNSGDIEKNWTIPVGGLTFADAEYDPNGNDLAIIFSDYDDYMNIVYTPSVYDLDTDRLITGDPNEEAITDIIWLSNGDLVFGRYLEYSQAYYTRAAVSAESTVAITAFNRDDLSIVWENTITYVSSGSRLEFMEVADSGNLACDLGSECVLIDIDSGETVRSIQTDDYIVCTCDTGGEEFPSLITEGGKLIIPFWLDENFATVSYDVLDEDLEKVVVYGGIYTVKTASDHITSFYSDTYDEDMSDISPLGDGYSISYGASSGSVAAFIYHDRSWTQCRLLMVDASSNEVLDDIEFDFDTYAEITLVGVEGDKVYVFGSAYDRQDLFVIDATDSSIDVVDLGDTNPGSPPLLVDGKICAYSRHNGDYCISVYDTASGELESVDLPIDGYMYFDGIPHYLAGMDLIVCSYDSETRLFDLKTGDSVKADMPDEWDRVVSAACDPETGKILMSDGRLIVCVDEDGDILEDMETEVGGRLVIDISFTRVGDRDMFMILFSDGCLNAYSSDLTLEGTAALDETLQYNIYHPVPYTYTYDEDEDLLFVEGNDFVSVVAVSEWYETTHVDNCYTYCTGSDRFYVGYEDDTVLCVGCFDRLSDEELIAKAEEYLGGAQLSDAQRAQYAI